MSYIPNTDADCTDMLAAIGVTSVDALFDQIPEPLRFRGNLAIPGRLNQISLMRHLVGLARKNVNADDFPCFLGAGIYDHYIPPTVAAITGPLRVLYFLHSLSAGTEPGNAAKHL